MTIVAKNLTVAIRKNQPILSDLSFTIEEGEFVLVQGPSGSGKSFFALCLNGIVPQVIPAHYSGSLQINGQEVSQTPVSEMATQVGLVFQDPDAQLIAMFVEDEIVFGPENLLLERDEIGRRLEHSLALVGMSEFKDVHTWSLSGGQKQRAAIGSVLAMEPSILVLDEPTSNLDPEGTESVFDLLAQLRDDTNMTIIAIEHKVDSLIQHVDRMLVFDQGKIVVNGAPRDVIRRHGHTMMRQGINLPQVSELGLQMAGPEPSRQLERLPLTVRDAMAELPVEPVAAPAAFSQDGAGPVSEPILKCDQVWFNYPGRPPALTDINLAFRRGEFIAVVGQNGAGKTTLTKLFIGLLKATRGRVLLKDQNVADIPLERLTEQVGYVFQYPDNQLVTDTVFDEIAFSMKIREYPEDEITAKVEEVLSTVELTHLQKRHPLTLSMGEKRRLSVATMLVLNQDILILDEPTMGMDWGHVISIMKICRELQRQGRTILMVTHDMRVVGDWADRVIAMANSKVMLDSAPRDFFLNEPLLQQTRLSQLPVCPWRDCREDMTARCRSCQDDFLAALVEKHRIEA